MTDHQIKHLELVQAVINRLAGNSFSIKGWSITLVSALFVLAAKDANARYAILALLPALGFWGLDAYYLRQERLFRKLYDSIRTQTADPSFSMNTSPVAGSVDSWIGTAFSDTILALHGPIVLAVVTVTIISAMK
jgi:hypothetical protein